jgi:hypothetical protein
VHQHIIRYKIKPTQVARHEELDRAVHDELARSRPAGLRYATFRLDDGVSFLHLVQEAEDATDSLPSVAAFNEFRADLRERCDEVPVRAELTIVGAYELGWG